MVMTMKIVVIVTQLIQLTCSAPLALNNRTRSHFYRLFCSTSNILKYASKYRETPIKACWATPKAYRVSITHQICQFPQQRACKNRICAYTGKKIAERVSEHFSNYAAYKSQSSLIPFKILQTQKDSAWGGFHSHNRSQIFRIDKCL